MKHVLALTIVLLASQMSFAMDGYDIGHCQAQAQAAAKAIGKINGFGPKNFVLNLQGSPDHVETYQDSEGYFEIVTNTGMGENTCVVESVDFNPKP
jgi:hypothetical protein